MKKQPLLFFILLLILFTISNCKTDKTKLEKKDKNMPIEIIVGTYTNSESKGIYKLLLTEKGEMINKHLIAEIENPSYLALSKDNNFVYAVQENEAGKVFAYKWSADKKKLIVIDSIKTNGKHPCYVSVNSKKNALSFANYSSGNIGIIKINENGSFKKESNIHQHTGKGIVKGRQDFPHAHCTVFKNDETVYAVDLGIDKILKYTITNTGKIVQELVLESKGGDGFRHLIFHPNKEVSYVINEFTNSIIVSQVEKSGVFKVLQKISTLPNGVKKESFAADIHISNDGKFLYASNRGHNSISAFSISEKGQLTFVSNTNVKGNWPRNFMLTKDDEFLIVANQLSNNIVVFKRDVLTGELTYTNNQLELFTPVFLKSL